MKEGSLQRIFKIGIRIHSQMGRAVVVYSMAGRYSDGNERCHFFSRIELASFLHAESIAVSYNNEMKCGDKAGNKRTTTFGIDIFQWLNKGHAHNF